MENGDYIKREDAIIEIERFGGYLDDVMLYRIKLALNRLNRLPSADVVEVRHGRWVDRTQEPGWPVAECSVCGSHAGMFWMNYCPNCGARMDGDNDE